VEVIYAPLDELRLRCRGRRRTDGAGGGAHYIDGAVEAVERILRESPSGDLLVFMPAERDIRETAT
jgi:ATP-dependent helicase HrpA